VEDSLTARPTDAYSPSPKVEYLGVLNTYVVAPLSFTEESLRVEALTPST
jgi:hypothetical protein